MISSLPSVALVSALIAPALAPAWASPGSPAAQALESAPGKYVEVRSYAPSAIYPVRTAPGTVTDLALQPGERLVAVAAGDTARWIIGDTTSGSAGGQRTHVLVKPVAPGLETNAVITTDRRVYHLLLSSQPRLATVALSWTYPEDALIAYKAPSGPSSPPVAAPVVPEIGQLNFGYAIRGPRTAWRPVRVFDDGRKTYVEFPPALATSEAPPLFVPGSEGKPELVNYRVRGRYYVVDRVIDAAELRLGTRRPQVVRISRTAEATPHLQGSSR